MSLFKILRDLLLCLAAGALFCLSIMCAVNYFSPAPTHEYCKQRCTRYCHDHGCPHVAERYSDSSNTRFIQIAGYVYKYNILLLGKIPFLSYKQANILIYVVLFPLLWILLLSIILAQRRRIRALDKDQEIMDVK